MSSIFCCSSPSPYRPALLTHEAKFDPFIAWAKRSESLPNANSALLFHGPDNLPPYAVQFVQQVNYGAIEAKRYFVPSPEAGGDRGGFLEITEQDLITWNFQKLNSYKNFKCTIHNKFFEVNLYQKDPVNKHHWRLNVARPAGNIDLQVTLWPET